jgi:hypothetical protein
MFRHRAERLGTVEAANEKEAIEKAAEEFDYPARAAEPNRCREGPGQGLDHLKFHNLERSRADPQSSGNSCEFPK